MDWFTKRKFVIVCHDKVVRIPLEGDEILRVHGEHTQGVVKTLRNTKVGESKLSDISIVRDFIDVFSDDLLELPLQRQVEFRVDLVHRATQVKSWKTRVSYDLVIFRGEHPVIHEEEGWFFLHVY
nr:hypothetical protein [Tanacetum cinerariifolium]